MDSERTYRNHPTVIISNLATTMIVIAVLILINIGDMDTSEYRSYIVAGLAVLAICLAALYTRWWQKTTFVFMDTEMVVRFDLISKKVKRIPYNRLASVNVKRNLYNILFGTSTLMFNVNSSVNSTQAEAALVLKQPEADALREELSQKIFDKGITVDEDKKVETMMHVSNADVILHGFLAQPTYSALFGLLMMLYSIYSLFLGNGDGFFVALILFLITTLVPWIRIILKYYNYRIYRVDDTITVDSGLITNYRTSFKVSKINSVRIREPLLARILGKATLEAEVVGTADQFGMPILCPLKSKKDVESLIPRLIPEFVMNDDAVKQPSRASGLMFSTSLIITAVFSLCVYAVHYLVSLSTDPEDIEIAGYIADYGVVVVAAVLAILIIRIPLASRRRSVSCGDELFSFVIGGYDISTEIMRYDKVQIAEVSSGPMARYLGLSTCNVSLISSLGATTVISGLFEPSVLERVPSEVIERITDGRYDYRRYL